MVWPVAPGVAHCHWLLHPFAPDNYAVAIDLGARPNEAPVGTGDREPL
jgi:hypothetical protein